MTEAPNKGKDTRQGTNLGQIQFPRLALDTQKIKIKSLITFLVPLSLLYF